MRGYDRSQKGILTKCIAVTHLSPPATHEMHFVLWNGGHLWVPVADELVVLFDLVWLDIVEDNRVYVLPASEDLREAALNVFVELSTLWSSVDE